MSLFELYTQEELNIYISTDKTININSDASREFCSWVLISTASILDLTHHIVCEFMVTFDLSQIVRQRFNLRR